MIDPQLEAQIEGIGENALFDAENCLGLIDSTPDFTSDMQWTSYPTPEATQSTSQENPHLELPKHIASNDLQLPGFGILGATCDPPMSFRDRHRFLNRVYNSCSDPGLITASALGDVAREVGLLMEEVLAWFNDEKSRRAELLASTQHQKSACQFPPSPESTRASGEISSASSPYTATFTGTPQQPDIPSPCPAPAEQKTLTPPTTSKRGRPAKMQVKLEPDLASPDAKRKKVSMKYPCPDCGTFVAVERWMEHINRRHFPEIVWECPKTNQQTGKPCSASSHYRPSYRHDNFATHLKGEHDCADTEVAELKKTCKYQVTDFYHKVCGFCDIPLANRGESIEHIKGHLRSTSEQPNAPADFGVSLWKEKCGIEHKLQLGIHYRKPKTDGTVSQSEQNEHGSNDDGSGGPSEGNSDNPDIEGSGSGPANHSHGHGHDEEKHSAGDSVGNSCHESSDFQSNTHSLGNTSHEDVGRIIEDHLDNIDGRQNKDPVPSSQLRIEVKDENLPELPGISSLLSSLPSPPSHTTSEDSMKSPRDSPRHRTRRLSSKEEANFRCHVAGCRKSFGRSYNFKAHMETHARKRPYLCPVDDCSRQFSSKTDLERHHEHSHKEPAIYSCDHCSRVFEKDELKKHTDDGCPKTTGTKSFSGCSIAETTYNMLSRHMHGPEDTEIDFSLYPDPQNMYSNFPFSLGTNTYPRLPEAHSERDVLFSASAMYAESPHYAMDPPELRAPSSNYSSASLPSASSVSMGSPYSLHGSAAPLPEWAPHGLGLNPSIISYDNFDSSLDYTIHPSGMDDFDLRKKPGFVDPSILHPQYNSSTNPSPRPVYIASPYLYPSYPYPPPSRRPGIQYHSSTNTSISSEGSFSSEEIKEKGRCAWPDCGKMFKDLKAHMLTHQNARPEKCPIQTCDYHIKGFARKYDKNRHTLTHYKGTMVCGFCPGSGSAAEKSFNRADVFKRHLTSVHGVEQTPPNSRKKTSNASPVKKLSGYAPDATGKCSTCSGTFSNAQDFYEHLDDCVLRIVQQEEPTESINAALLLAVDVAVDRASRDELNPPSTTSENSRKEVSNDNDPDEEDNDDDFDDENDDDFTLRSRSQKKHGNSPAANNGVQKSRGLTHSKGGVILNTKGRKKRKDYPSSWGCPPSQMKMKKRILCVFDGPRRLWKDEMMLDTDYEARMKLSDGNEKRYITDLDVETMKQADAFHSSTEEEKGPWIVDDLTGVDLEKLMEVKGEVSSPVKEQSPGDKAVKFEVEEKTSLNLFRGNLMFSKDLKSTGAENSLPPNGYTIEVG